jgi:hypothetical protein
MNITIKAVLVCLCLMPVSTPAMSVFLTVLGALRSGLIKTMVAKKQDMVLKKDDEKAGSNSFLHSALSWMTFGYYKSTKEALEEAFIGAVQKKDLSEIKKIYNEAKEKGFPLNLNKEFAFFKDMCPYFKSGRDGKKATPLIAIIGSRHHDINYCDLKGKDQLRDQLQLDIVQFLIENNADPIQKSMSVDNGNTFPPLVEAILNSEFSVVQYLLSIEKVKKAINWYENERSPVYYAFYRHYYDKSKFSEKIVKLLLIDSSASCRLEDFYDFSTMAKGAIKNNDIDNLKRILDANSQHYEGLEDEIGEELLRYGSVDALDLFIRKGLLKPYNIPPDSFACLYSNKHLKEILKYFKQYQPQIFNKIYCNKNNVELKVLYHDVFYKDVLSNFIASLLFMEVPLEKNNDIISLLLTRFLKEQKREKIDIDKAEHPGDRMVSSLTPLVSSKTMQKWRLDAYNEKVISGLLDEGGWRPLIPWLMWEPNDRPAFPKIVKDLKDYPKLVSGVACNLKGHTEKTCCCYRYCKVIEELWPKKIDTEALPDNIPRDIVDELKLADNIYKKFNGGEGWKCLPLDTNNIRSSQKSAGLIDFNFNFK